MNIINLTPHSINLYNSKTGAFDEIAPSGIIARVSSHTEIVGNYGDYSVTATVFGDIENLPDPVEDTIYIVSSIVKQRCFDRRDVMIPSESVRDESGRIIGCKSLGI